MRGAAAAPITTMTARGGRNPRRGPSTRPCRGRLPPLEPLSSWPGGGARPPPRTELFSRRLALRHGTARRPARLRPRARSLAQFTDDQGCRGRPPGLPRAATRFRVSSAEGWDGAGEQHMSVGTRLSRVWWCPVTCALCREPPLVRGLKLSPEEGGAARPVPC